SRGALLDWVENEQNKAARKSRSKGALKPARHVAKSAETWRCLSNYPNYEISAYGRVRSINRAKPNDCLKPRWHWRHGACVDYVVLTDLDGIRRERQIGWLLVSVGFLKKPDWARKSSSVE